MSDKAKQKNKAVDLADLDVQTPADAGTVVELEHPATGDPILDEAGVPWTITVLGDDAGVVRALDRKHQDRRAEKMRKGKDWALDAASLDAERTDRLVAATIAWHGITLNGETLDCNAKNVAKIYGDKRFAWVGEQLTRAMVDRTRFFVISSTS